MDTLTQPTSGLARWGHPQLARMDRIEENGADRYLSPYNLNVGDGITSSASMPTMLSTNLMTDCSRSGTDNREAVSHEDCWRPPDGLSDAYNDFVPPAITDLGAYYGFRCEEDAKN